MLKHGQLDSMIEIGLGDFGGTRRLWTEIFNEVYTVEPRRDFIDRYLQNTPQDNPDKIICAYSPDFSFPNWQTHQFDFCFIDGDHTYHSAHRDYVKLEPYVKSGGIIGFHDSKNGGMGSAQFINTLRDTFDMKNIWHPDGFGGGISYYIKD